mmetsp:Transcript_29561/g.56797  ORF Transcript_29561/g.56797 Transcript_29561/m.56797 type:complete len:202 (-) Transcript_29561:545-1150(-)
MRPEAARAHRGEVRGFSIGVGLSEMAVHARLLYRHRVPDGHRLLRRHVPRVLKPRSLHLHRNRTRHVPRPGVKSKCARPRFHALLVRTHAADYDGFHVGDVQPPVRPLAGPHVVYLLFLQLVRLPRHQHGAHGEGVRHGGGDGRQVHRDVVPGGHGHRGGALGTMGSRGASHALSVPGSLARPQHCETRYLECSPTAVRCH